MIVGGLSGQEINSLFDSKILMGTTLIDLISLDSEGNRRGLIFKDNSISVDITSDLVNGSLLGAN